MSSITEQNQATKENNENRTLVCIEMDTQLNYKRSAEVSNSNQYLQSGDHLEGMNKMNGTVLSTAHRMNEIKECQNLKVMKLADVVKVLKINRKTGFNHHHHRKRHNNPIGSVHQMNLFLLK